MGGYGIRFFTGTVADRLLVLLIAVAGLSIGSPVRADDTEIYQSSYAASSTGRPKVLIVLDNSGSMSTIVEGQRPAYDPNASYSQQFPSDRVYWSTTGQPPSQYSSQWFYSNTNRCAESYTPLSQTGFFQSAARRWDAIGTTEYCFNWFGFQFCWPIAGGSPGWKTLSSSDNDPAHIECEADVINDNASNGSGVSNGFPKSTSTNGLEYSAATAAASDVDWSGNAYTFYSAHYMDWYYDASLRTDRTRLDIAKDVITTLIDANTAIDFGLTVFNYNYGGIDNGGRIVNRIITDMSLSERANLTTLVNGLGPDTWTPLCEATYEAYRYLSGSSVLYGDDTSDTPARDLLAESPHGTYSSPATDCAYTYVILMTDGEPSYDTNANSAIASLANQSCSSYPDYAGNNVENCLPVLADYMANTDLDGDSSNGDQFAITYTIGFTTDQQLLSDTAQSGKGTYYTADSADELSAAFQGAVLSILSTDSTFTSPSVAVDTFTRTQSLNDVFFAMFKPNDRLDWPGNIKKLRLSVANGSATLVDANGNPAMDAATGQIKATATTIWSTTADGPSVQEGGVGALLAARSPSTRVIYANAGVDLSGNPTDALVSFDTTDMTAAGHGFTSDAQLYAFYGAANQGEYFADINWGRGEDVNDEDGDGNVTEARSWILADMLHSQPLVINYGATGSPFTTANPELRILVGTNAGFLHMFHDAGTDAGQEAWAFFARELGPVLQQRRINAVSSQHVYGIDSPPVAYTLDINKDGTIDSSAGDKAYVYFGLRRGGNILYALDISDPDSPSFLWKIDNTVAGFAELGQTWSIPKVTRVPGYNDANGEPKPVLIFGGGYDPVKDSTGLVTDTNDTIGRGIFIVDAVTGALVWSVTPAVNSATNMQETGLIHSVPGAVTTLDSNGDEITDRIYFGDAGGNVWRVDLPGNTRPALAQTTWRIEKLFVANGGSVATDRRFFNAPDVVSTLFNGNAIDAVLIASGDRTNPNAVDVTNQFYMIRDEQVVPYVTARPSASACSATPPADDFRCHLPLTTGDLYDASSNILQTGTAAQKASASTALANANGWLIDLPANGEKGLAKSLTIDGKVFFTSFSPDATVTNLCEPTPGDGRLYIVDLLDATAVRDFDSDGTLERSWIIGSLIPDTPSPHFGSDGEIRLLLPPGSTGGGTVDNPFETGATIPGPYGSYWYREDY